MNEQNWKFEAQKHAAAAGELKFAIAERLREIKKKALILMADFECENSERECMKLATQIKTLQAEQEWIESVLYRKQVREHG